MKKDLFFINEISAIDNNDLEARVTLFRQCEEDGNDMNIEESKIIKQKIIYLERNNIKEGKFVYLKQENNKLLLINANNDKRAKQQILKNNKYRGNLIKKYSKLEKKDDALISNIYSYHINVGHGNCSIIVFKESDTYKIWMIDCSIYDFINKRSYKSNIESTFEFIRTKFSTKIKIEKLFITHPHYDHYNGVNYLIYDKFIDKDTEVWINLYYSWPESKYNLLLEKFIDLDFKLVEPKCLNSNDIIKILYPQNTIFRVHPRRENVDLLYDIVPSNKINNSSSIIKLNLGEKSMIFPGDIEKDGWNKLQDCCRNLNDSNFYCISHHGSITGHKRSQCPLNMNINDISRCFNTEVNILMGRDKAYKGIFSQEVLDCFKNKIYKTDTTIDDKELQFIELNWSNKQVTNY